MAMNPNASYSEGHCKLSQFISYVFLLEKKNPKIFLLIFFLSLSLTFMTLYCWIMSGRFFFLRSCIQLILHFLCVHASRNSYCINGRYVFVMARNMDFFLFLCKQKNGNVRIYCISSASGYRK